MEDYQFIFSQSGHYFSAYTFFREQFVRRGHRFDVTKVAWKLQHAPLADDLPVSRVLFKYATANAIEACFEEPDGRLCYINLGSCELELTFENTKSLDTLELLIARLKVAFPELLADTTSVPVEFWAYNGQNARSWTRQIGTVNWPDIQQNYSAKTGPDVAKLMGFVPERGGIVLSHGDPGTGKTYALRAMMRAWVEWCDFHYITDPERFFGEGNYMLDVLLDDADDEDNYHINGKKKTGRWQLYILEDAGELLATDAKEIVGQGLSRLLNIADGLIGQGLKAIIFISTNEPLKKFHPAVVRPGRCLAEVEFFKLSREECSNWLGVPVSHGLSLAELYAIKGGVDPSHFKLESLVGFQK